GMLTGYARKGQSVQYSDTASMLSGYGRAGQLVKYSDTATMLSTYTRKRQPSSATRSFNSSFQVSATKDASVRYSVEIACSISVSGGQAGVVFLEISPNNSTWTEAGRFSNSNTGAVVIGLSVTSSVAGQISADVPAGYYVRLRTSATTGSPVFTYQSGQETY
ncbi:hypothetical protein, partial [Sediminibacterium ginsengisoli]